MAVILQSQKEVDLNSGLKVDAEVVDGKLQLKVIGTIDNVIKNPLVPILTSNTTPAPFVASASSQYPSYAPWRAFDGTVDSDINRWISGIDLPLPQWLKIDLGQQKKLYSYALTMVAGGDQSPQSWVLEGSNDNINWSIVHNITNDPPWNSKERREYIVNSSQYYRYYRIMVTQKYGGRATTIGELELFERYFDHYSHSGHVEYGPIDLGLHFREITSISTIKEIPQGTDIKMYTSTSNDYINFSEWSLVDVNGNITSPKGRYVKIKIELFGNTIENTQIVYDFSQEDQLKFQSNEFVIFDGSLKLKTLYQTPMELNNNFQESKLYEGILEKNKFKKIEKINNIKINKIDLSGGSGGTSGQKVYTAQNSVIVTSSAPVYTNSNNYYMGYLFNDTKPNYHDANSYWLTSSSGNQTLTFDFGSIMPVYISQIKVWPRCRSDASSNYRILVSDDGINFTEVVPWVINTHDSLTPYGTVRVHDVNITNRYVRFELTQNDRWGVCLQEIEFFQLIGNYLIEDDNKIKKYDVNLGWQVVGDPPVTKSMFDLYGMNDISIISDDAIKNLVSDHFKILYCTNEEITNNNLEYIAVPKPVVISSLENLIIDGNLKKVNLSAFSSENSILKIVVSTDNGVSWKSYKSNFWDNVNIANLNDVKNNGMSVEGLNSLTEQEWKQLSSKNNIKIAFYLEQDSSSDLLSIDSMSVTELLTISSPKINNIIIIYDELDKKYSGLMFMDTSQQYYSTSFGEILKYLDFGTMISGQTSLDVKVYLTNTLPFDVKNIRIYPEYNIDGLTVELSKTNLPFIAESELFYDQVLGFDEVIEFYVRLTTDKNKVGGGTFDIKVKADAV